MKIILSNIFINLIPYLLHRSQTHIVGIFNRNWFKHHIYFTSFSNYLITFLLRLIVWIAYTFTSFSNELLLLSYYFLFEYHTSLHLSQTLLFHHYKSPCLNTIHIYIILKHCSAFSCHIKRLNTIHIYIILKRFLAPGR